MVPEADPAVAGALRSSTTCSAVSVNRFVALATMMVSRPSWVWSLSIKPW
ncbi:hypothetical protein AB0K14_26325 [Actinosynnema sp. NPDC050801]